MVFSFIGISLLLTLSPGPDILFVLAQSIVQHAKAGIVTALGLCTGLMVHVSAAVFGVSAVIYQSAAAFEIVKYAGAAYLLFLAFQSFTAGESADGPSQGEAEKYHKLYMKGIFMNLAQPEGFVILPCSASPLRRSLPRECFFTNAFTRIDLYHSGFSRLFPGLGVIRKNSTERASPDVDRKVSKSTGPHLQFHCHADCYQWKIIPLLEEGDFWLWKKPVLTSSGCPFVV